VAGWLSNMLKTRKKVLLGCVTLGLISVYVVVYGPLLSYASLSIWLFLFGLAAAGQSLAFAVVQDRNNPATVGTAIGINNMFVVISGAIFQPIASVLLSSVWNGQKFQGAPVFTIQNYQVALAVLPVIFVLGWFIVRFWIKETFVADDLDVGAAPRGRPFGQAQGPAPR
jgi:MFS family permease